MYFLQTINELIEQQATPDGLRAKLIATPYVKEGVLERYDSETRKIATIDNPLKHKFLNESKTNI
jgi:hypothetical protein